MSEKHTKGLENQINPQKEQVKSFNERVSKRFTFSLDSVVGDHLTSNKTFEALVFLGGLICDTNYKQQKYFRTQGILKQIAIFTNYITTEKIKAIFKKCNRLQRAISEKEYRQLPNILRHTKEKISNIDLKLETSQFDLNLAITTGYNLYSKVIYDEIKITEEQAKVDNSDGENHLKNQQKTPINPPHFVQELEEAILQLPSYNKQIDFQLGFILGKYFFTIESEQRELLRTKSLLQKLFIILKQGNRKVIQNLIRELNIVAMKLLTQTSSHNEHIKTQNPIIKTFLSGNQYELAIFQLFNNKMGIIINKDEFLLGFGAAFTNYYEYILGDIENPFAIPEKIEPKLDKNDKPILLEEYFIKEFLGQELDTIYSKLTYLQGILFNSYRRDEEKILNITRLSKKFTFYFRNFNPKNILRLQVELYHTLLSLWIESIKNSSISQNFETRFLRIRLKLIDLFGSDPFLDLNTQDFFESANTLNFLQGYRVFYKLWEDYRTK